MEIGGKIVKLQVWDTAGQERFRTITCSYYRGSHGIMIMYSVEDRDSFRNIQKWHQEINRYACENISVMIVGGKCDEGRRVVSYEEGKEFADGLGLPFIEVSAKENINVQEAFVTLVQSISSRFAFILFFYFIFLFILCKFFI